MGSMGAWPGRLVRFAPVLGFLVALVFPLLSATAEAVPSAPTPMPAYPQHIRWVPAPTSRPAPVLVALHGMGDRGSAFTQSMLSRARAEGWVLVAPTITYGDWRNPTAVASEDVRLVRQLREWIEQLPRDTGLAVEPRVMLYGFSRGAQLAHRFTLVYPELVRAAVVLGAGTYTLPLESAPIEGKLAPLTWPFGCADFRALFGRKLNLDALRSVPFLVGVGELDNNPADLPRQWDRYEGSNRVERAQAFARALASLGVPTRFIVFPRTGHAPGGLQRSVGLDYLSRLVYRDEEPDPPFDRPLGRM